MTDPAERSIIGGNTVQLAAEEVNDNDDMFACPTDDLRMPGAGQSPRTVQIQSDRQSD